MEIEVDGERFRVVERAAGGYDLTWLTGPNPGYGFSSSGMPLDPGRLAQTIRGFLAGIDPATGYLGEDPAAQPGYPVCFEWGLPGARSLAASAAVSVVVDVLSFTTTLSVAADLGIDVLPHAGSAEDAARLAADRGATVAGPRTAAHGPSLSPASLRRWDAPGRIVLPSPNGSTISRRLADLGTTVVGASLRNAHAVAAEVGPLGRVLVVAAGERWPDGSLRPAVEDLWGAGAVIDALQQQGLVLSPEASAAAAAYREVRGHERTALHGCTSGLELGRAGFAGDVDIAAEVGRSTSVPTLVDGVFVS